MCIRDRLKRAADALANGSDQVGVDAERASGFRYGSEAYLVQMYRRGSGTFLFDPTLLDDFSVLRDAVIGEEWILHAASQELPCLGILGRRPETLFDTARASRLLGFERVGLGSVVEQLLDIQPVSYTHLDVYKRQQPDRAWHGLRDAGSRDPPHRR